MTVTINGTSGIAGTNGSAGTPAVQGEDTNTGIFFPAADTVAVATAGAERVRVDSSGNLLVGTTSLLDTGARLNVAGGTIAHTGNQLNVRPGSAANYEFVNRNGAGFDFYTNSGGVQAMRIANNGELLIGTTTSSGSKVHAVAVGNVYSGYCTGAVGAGIVYVGSRDTNGPMAFWINNGSVVGQISVTSSATTYATSSDYRLKENVAPMQNALDTVAQLNPVTYTWKADGSAGQGFIAHELQAVVPDCVTGEKDAMREEQYEVTPAIAATYDAEGNVLTEAVPAVMGTREVPSYQGVDTSFLVATLVKAIQELTARVTQLEAQ